MARRVASNKPADKDLPKDVPPGFSKKDLEYPKWSPKPGAKNERVVHTLRFTHSERFGWVVATLPINARTQRTYATNLAGNIITTGNPSTAFITVHVRESRAEIKGVKEWIEAYGRGMGDASGVRDRIGSRRAEGQVKRAQGLTSWRWDN